MQELKEVVIQWGVKIPLRDGISLSASVYTPKGPVVRAPCILMLTPYVADNYHQRGLYFASHGLPFVAVDVRGRGNSDGMFRPKIQEAGDGPDVVEWLARQPYCDGKVAMCGGSYLGYSQWVTAKEFPPHLVTIVPTASPYVGVDFPMRSNIFFSYSMRWLTLVSGRSRQTQIFGDEAYWSAVYRDWFMSGRPFRELDSISGNPSPIFQEWLDHPQPDAHWDAYNPTADRYARIDLPVLTVTGAYDGNQLGALEHYRQHMRHGSATARRQHYLIIGPWDHVGTSFPATEFQGLKLGPDSVIDMQKLHLQWYEWTMLGRPKPDFLRKQVAYYVTAAERWRYADSLEAVTARDELYFLESAGNANDVFSSGSLQLVPGSGGPDGYTYDPRDEQARGQCDLVPAGLVNSGMSRALWRKRLVYHSAPFERDIEVSGCFRFSAWISIDCPDTDFFVTVSEIARDGSSIELSWDCMRARYREGLRSPKVILSSDPLRYEFNRFTFVSRCIRRGHRLRLVVAPTVEQLTEVERNCNAGGTVAEEFVQHARSVTVRLFHDVAHPSVLYVPLGHPESPEELTAPESAFVARSGPKC